MKKQSGFTAIELVLVVAMVALIGFAGYTAYHNHQNVAENEATQTASRDNTGSIEPKASVVAAPEINSASDLNAAESSVDQVNVDDNNSDGAQLDSELSNF